MAWSHLAHTFVLKGRQWLSDAKEGYERARQLAQHALQLSPDLAEAHALLGVHLLNVGLGLGGGGERRTTGSGHRSNESGCAEYRRNLSYTLGRWDEAERQLRAALVRDPLNPYVIWNLGFTYYGAGRFAEAEATYRKLLELEPGFCCGLAVTLARRC